MSKLGDELREMAKAKKETHDKVRETIIPMIEKKVRERAKAGFHNVVIPLGVDPNSNEWQIIVDWAIDEEIGCRVADEKKKIYRFMW